MNFTTFQYVTIALQLLTIVFIPIFKYWVSQLEKKDSENKDEISCLSTELSKFKKEVSDDYVKKQDFLATTGEMMKKLDEISKTVYEIKGELKGRTKL